MGKSNYRLQPVLDVRERAKRDAARLLATRRAQLADDEAELARRQAALARCREEQRAAQAKLSSEAAGGARARLIVAHRTHLADLRLKEGEAVSAVDEQRAAVARAEREVDAALNALADASKEARVIEKHRENWQEAERRDARRRDQKISDEIAAVLRRRGS